eukprot:CAMPEP_0202493690 /NCGR_PEP_ID=MMETSP1361-20130828/9936_1 /ASSEMBLY_ACC=CAM_ASM_000849 /TAXON_ID=210615 /ORGANISM="Staurosira complex sp., Strain CCMP2646" /LENGTH=114 /DNA_ID=CAMNT_0049124033 /DNA_START=948 /DNA_END=1293 /DNA_ORIENTATION=+
MKRFTLFQTYAFGCAKNEVIHFVSSICMNKWVTPEQVGIIVGFGGIHILLMACEEEESDLVRAALERIGAVLKADMDSINFSKPLVEAVEVSELKKLISNGNYGVKYTVDKLRS